MEVMLVSIFTIALLYEMIDSSIGQGYGTLGTPTFILLGLDAYYVIPCILLSQAIGGFVGGIIHHRIGNYNLKTNHIDRTNATMLISFGVIGVIVGVFILSKTPSIYLNTYIGVLVIIIGILMVAGFKFVYSKKKMLIITLCASFNKGFSGGGYGGIATGGQVVTGSNTKNSVGVTTIAEVPICFTGFIIWCLMFNNIPPLWMLIPMCIGSSIAPFLGARITAFGEEKGGRKFVIFIGLVIIIFGISTLWKVFIK